MSNYPDLDAEERMTPEERIKASVANMDKLLYDAGCPFTPEEKAGFERMKREDILIDIKVETERIAAAEKAIKTAAYQKAKARRKAKREALEAGMTPEGLDYYKKLEQALRILPKTPPRELREEDYPKLKAIWLAILDRLGWLEWAKPSGRSEFKDGEAIVAEFTVTKEDEDDRR